MRHRHRVDTVCGLASPTLRRVSRNYSRFYEVDGHPDLFPSVTSVLNVLDKPGLKYWAVKQTLLSTADELAASQAEAGERPLTADEIRQRVMQCQGADRVALQKAGDFGTRAHDAIDQLIAGSRRRLVHRCRHQTDGQKLLGLVGRVRRDAGSARRYNGALAALRLCWGS